MNQYEVMYVIDTALEEQARTDLINRFSGLVEANGGQVDRVDECGKRRLAYANNYTPEPDTVQHYHAANEPVLRYLVIRFEGALPPKREPLKPYAPHAAAEAPVEAPAAQEEAPAAEASEQE